MRQFAPRHEELFGYAFGRARFTHENEYTLLACRPMESGTWLWSLCRGKWIAALLSARVAGMSAPFSTLRQLFLSPEGI